MEESDKIAVVTENRNKNCIAELRQKKYRKYKNGFCDLVIGYTLKNEEFVVTALTIADLLECSPKSVYNWLADQPEFKEAYDIARQMYEDRLIIKLSENGFGASKSYRHKKTTKMPDGSIIEEEVKQEAPDTKAIIYALRFANPTRFSETQNIDITSGGEIVRPKIVFAEPKPPKVIDVTPIEVSESEPVGDEI